ncbi:MAG: HAD-IIIA family hydrolase [Candidatus Nealsonbacteria bacterium]
MSIKIKIKTQKEIVEIIRQLKKNKKKIVTYNGSFDILHLGHIKSLEEAKQQGEVLIVPLNSDKSVKSYKGPNRPIVRENERAQTLAALSCVDYVVIFNEINPKEILNKIKPDIHCHGADWGKNCIEREIIESNGGKIHILKTVPGLSTTGLIKKILDVYAKPEIRAVFLDRDGTINVNGPGYTRQIKDFKFTSGALPALKKLSKTDYKIIIVTNQSGIGKGFFTEKDLAVLHRWMLVKFKKEKIRIDKIYHCPHIQEDNCSCRKPKIGMLEGAVRDFGINLSKSWIVGDSEKDVQMGKEANLKTIFLGKDAKNLAAAIKIILGKSR